MGLPSQKHTLSTRSWRMSDKILFSNVSYITPLGRSQSYFVLRADSELAPSAIRRMSVPAHQEPELKCYGQNSLLVARAASYPTQSAGSRDRGCMVRGLAHRRCRIIVFQHTAIRCQPLPDHPGYAESSAQATCRRRELGGSGVFFRAMQLPAIGARTR